MAVNELGTDETYETSRRRQEKQTHDWDWTVDSNYLSKLADVCGENPAYRAHVAIVGE